MHDDEFDWNDRKAARKLRDHDMSFELARDAYRDPDWVEEDDADPDEERYKRICMRACVLHVVVYTERGVRIRIISARRANRHEQQLYVQGQTR